MVFSSVFSHLSMRLWISVAMADVITQPELRQQLLPDQEAITDSHC